MRKLIGSGICFYLGMGLAYCGVTYTEPRFYGVLVPIAIGIVLLNSVKEDE